LNALYPLLLVKSIARIWSFNDSQNADTSFGTYSRLRCIYPRPIPRKPNKNCDHNRDQKKDTDGRIDRQTDAGL